MDGGIGQLFERDFGIASYFLSILRGKMGLKHFRDRNFAEKINGNSGFETLFHGISGFRVLRRNNGIINESFCVPLRRDEVGNFFVLRQ